MKAIIKSKSKYGYPMVEILGEFIELIKKDTTIKSPLIMPCKYHNKIDIGRELNGEIIEIPKYIILQETDDFNLPIKIFNSELLSLKEISKHPDYKTGDGILKIFWPDIINAT